MKTDPSVLNGSKNHKTIFHLLPNAHLDPVWLWDWREGLNEGLVTIKTVLSLMDEFPELTFIRGESAIYEHVQKTDPGTFQKILKLIQAGRWDVVGGTVIQPDTNLASTEVLCREFESGLAYFEKLGVRPRVAWQADSFGHSAGFPNILASFGMESFAFTRPFAAQYPIHSPAFWWEGDWKNRILCYRQYWKSYCSERGDVRTILSATLEQAQQASLTHVGVLFGLGNHGGGPTRRHLREIEQWRAQHPEVEVRYSTLHRFFDLLKSEVTPDSLPVVRGELGHCLRGCYSSVQKFKKLYYHGEARVADAEITRSLIGFATKVETPDLHESWQALSFNAFHDILPGSSIERAFEDQSAWMGMATHRADEAKFQALNLLAARVDMSVPPPRHPDAPTDVPFLIWNPQAKPFAGMVELEASMDYRPIFSFEGKSSQMPVVAYDHAGKALPLQVVATEHSSMPDLPWRKRVVLPVKIPAFGWTFVRLGWRDEWPRLKTAGATCSVKKGKQPSITNGSWSVKVKDGAVSVAHAGLNYFSARRNFKIITVEDPWGSWGGMNEEKDSYCLEKLRKVWKLQQSEILEEGPLRAKLWTRWEGGKSWMDLTFSVAKDTPWIKVEARLLWNERSARLKLVLPCAGRLLYDVPGGELSRQVEGQVPGGRWVTRTGKTSALGFASDILSDFDATEDELRVTLARATRYANDVVTGPTEKMWQPAVDCGELKFQFIFFAGDAVPDQVADSLRCPPTAMIAPAAQGTWARQGSLGRLKPDFVKLHSVEKIGADTLRVRLQNRSRRPTKAVLEIEGLPQTEIQLGPQQIKTLLLTKSELKNGALAATVDHDRLSANSLVTHFS